MVRFNRILLLIKRRLFLPGPPLHNPGWRLINFLYALQHPNKCAECQVFGRLKLEFNSHFIPITGKQDDLVADNNFLDLVSLPEKGVGMKGGT